MFIIKILCFSFRECKTGILTTPSKTTAKTRSEKHFGNYLMTCKVLLLSKSKQSTFKLWLKMRCKQVCQTYFYVKCVFRSQSNSSIEQHREGTLFQLQKKIKVLSYDQKPLLFLNTLKDYLMCCTWVYHLWRTEAVYPQGNSLNPHFMDKDTEAQQGLWLGFWGPSAESNLVNVTEAKWPLCKWGTSSNRKKNHIKRFQSCKTYVTLFPIFLSPLMEKERRK